MITQRRPQRIFADLVAEAIQEAMRLQALKWAYRMKMEAAQKEMEHAREECIAAEIFRG